MSNDYIQLSWNSDSSNSLPLGSYIEHEGERYSLIEPYTPSQKNEVEFVYTPQFKSRVMAWGKKPFFFYSGESREPDWALTSNPADFMRCVCDAILEETGESWSYSIDASLPASASLSFTSVDILGACSRGLEPVRSELCDVLCSGTRRSLEYPIYNRKGAAILNLRRRTAQRTRATCSTPSPPSAFLAFSSLLAS